MNVSFSIYSGHTEQTKNCSSNIVILKIKNVKIKIKIEIVLYQNKMELVLYKEIEKLNQPLCIQQSQNISTAYWEMVVQYGTKGAGQD